MIRLICLTYHGLVTLYVYITRDKKVKTHCLTAQGHYQLLSKVLRDINLKAASQEETVDFTRGVCCNM